MCCTGWTWVDCPVDHQPAERWSFGWVVTVVRVGAIGCHACSYEPWASTVRLAKDAQLFRVCAVVAAIPGFSTMRILSSPSDTVYGS